MDFIVRIYKDTTNNVVLSSFQSITISNITLITKHSKFDEPCIHKGNQKKFGYTMEISKNFNKVSGSHSTPTLTFKGEYIDVTVRNFPRYPAFSQDIYAARSCLSGFGYTNYMNKGFMHQLLYRKIEIINI